MAQRCEYESLVKINNMAFYTRLLPSGKFELQASRLDSREVNQSFHNTLTEVNVEAGIILLAAEQTDQLIANAIAAG